MPDWLASLVTKQIELPAYIVSILAFAYPVAKAVFSALGWLSRLLLGRRVGKHLDGYEKKSREWAIGEISFLGPDGRWGFIDPRTGRKNAFFAPGTVDAETTVILGQRVRFLADWSKPQPIATKVKPLPKLAAK